MTDMATDPQLAAFDAVIGENLIGKALESDPIDVVKAVNRFVLIHGTTQVFDTQQGMTIKKPAFELLVGKDVAGEWAKSPQRRVATAEDVKKAKAQLDERKWQADAGYASALDRYVLIEGTESIWDSELDEVVPAGAVRLHLGEMFKLWQNSPARRSVLKNRLVFDPTQQVCPESYINMFKGLPMTPDFPAGLPEATVPLDLAEAFPKCKAIINLTLSLCNDDPMDWMWLMCWLALPLQRVGAKMHTFVLMHSDVQGSGKSMFFEGVMKPIYGLYATTVGQDQLDGNFSGWRSRKLFLLGEEIVNNREKYSQSGKIKHIVTGKTQVLEKKFVDAWEEQNFANLVMLSNLYMPTHVEKHDRRTAVIWPERVLSEAMQDAVDAELRNGGVEAFYAFLLSIPLAIPSQATGEPVPFRENTKPLDTEARRRLIRMGLSAWEAFFIGWESGELGVPYGPVLVWQLYGLYHQWCVRDGGKTSPMAKRIFSEMVSAKMRRRPEHWSRGTVKGQSTAFTPKDQGPPAGVSRQEWVGQSIHAFKLAAQDAGWNVDEWEAYRDQPVRRDGEV
ncbi:DUF5906 domain-containing protein [Laribacter hongkongensis]|uniref:primase-helicase family protein n=1 Tax=Laribacter hongkongensis TaxID=168471 RepID=UPI001EFE8E11|nr:primase-helicase family protein [Laribacter hongkongensis]MCG9105619.1 DUF5906 domain-containing protein [Laribacter hongkongensis]